MLDLLQEYFTQYYPLFTWFNVLLAFILIKFTQITFRWIKNSHLNNIYK